MPWTAWKNPGTVSSQARTGGAVSWTGTASALASDNTYATALLNGNSSHWLWCTNFGFTSSDIPSDATITGIKARFERKQNNGSDGGIQVTYVKIIIGGAEAGTQKTSSASWPLAEAVSTDFGGSSDVWGTTITQADAIASTTGAAFAGEDQAFFGSVGSIDTVELAFEYSIPSSRRRIFAVAVG